MHSYSNSKYRTTLRKIIKPHKKSLMVLMLTLGIYFTFIFSQMLSIRPDGLYAGHVHVWGDWSLHVGMASIFAYRDPGEWFIHHPYYAGGKLTYAFLTNLISGLLIRLGLSLPAAFIIPSIFYIFTLILGLYALFFQLLRKSNQALLAVYIFFLSSGPGFTRLISDWVQNPNKLFIFPEKDYSRLEEYQWLAGNFVNGMLVPQRSFLLGMMLSVWSLVGLFFALHKKGKSKKQLKFRKKILLFSGLLAGILPIAHMHSFIVLVIVIGLICASYYKRWQELVWFVAPAGVVGSLLFALFIYGGIDNPNFIAWQPGWTAPSGLYSWLVMWLRIWGLMIPVAIVGVFMQGKASKLKKMFYLGLGLVFTLANLLRMQPVSWDNSKLFLWVYVGLSALAAEVIIFLWARQKNWLRSLSIIIFLSLTLTGGIELLRLAHVKKNEVMMSPTSDITMGKYLRQVTSPQDIFLTNTSHNHPVMMWGARPIFMGYPTWVMNFGFDQDTRQGLVKKIYRGHPRSLELIRENNISYVVVGPGEIYDQGAKENYFSTNFPVLYADKNYRIYDVRSH